jgi:hypothetical protein
VTGGAAASLWDAVGGCPRDRNEDTGTSIMILDPDLRMDVAGQDVEGDASSGGDPADLGVHILERVLWNFWPRMLHTTPEERRLHLEIEVDGEAFEIPRPEDCPPLDLFARAMNILRSGQGDAVMCGKPIAMLGSLAISRGLRGDRLPIFGQGGLFPSHASHVALMRPAEMVVCYLKGDALPDERTEWGGVFVTSEAREVEEAFASSEPAAHDIWDPTGLPKGHARTYVSVAMRRLKEAADAVARPAAAPSATPAAEQSVAAVASRLGTFLAGVGEGGPSRGRGPGGPGGRGPRRQQVSSPVFTRLETWQGQRTALFTMTVSGQGALSALSLTPMIAMDGGGAPAAGLDLGPVPQVVGVETDGGQAFEAGEAIDFGDFEGELTVRLTVPDNCAVGLRAELTQGIAR